MKDKFVFSWIPLLYYRCHKKNPNCGRPYIDWLNKKQKSNKKTINKKDNKCFQYAVIFALNHEKIKRHSERITKVNLL